MDDIEEKRVFDDRVGAGELVVAAGAGLLSVSVSADRVGRFSLVHGCTPADVASDRGLVAVATAEDVLVRDPGVDEFEGTGFGHATAVGVDDGELVAANPDGRVARLDCPAGGGQWADLGRLDAEVRAIDGGLIAASDGVRRLPDLSYVGLDDVRDVAAAGPLAATGAGLYSLGNGWMDELDGDFRVAATTQDGGLAHAATTEAFYERRDGEWTEVDLPVDGPVVDVAYGEVPYAVTEHGVLLAEGETENANGAAGAWRAQPLGVGGVVGCAIR